MILITGKEGQLGREMQKILLNSNIEFLALDRLKLDIINLDNVKHFIHYYNPRTVINCAAYTNVDKCEEDTETAFAVNAIGAKNISIATNAIGCKVFYISSDYVFDGRKVTPYKENDIPNPINTYGKSKLKGEEFTRIYNPKHFIIRTAWLYGEGKNFIRKILSLSREKEIKVVNDQIGTPTSTLDLAKAILYLMNTNNYGIYHGTCKGYCSWYDFAKKIFNLKNIDINIKPITTKELVYIAQRPRYSVLENYMLNQSGYMFRHWEDSLKDYLRSEV